MAQGTRDDIICNFSDQHLKRKQSGYEETPSLFTDAFTDSGCLKHPNRTLTYICFDCKTAICTYCVIYHNQNHHSLVGIDDIMHTTSKGEVEDIISRFQLDILLRNSLTEMKLCSRLLAGEIKQRIAYLSLEEEKDIDKVEDFKEYTTSTFLAAHKCFLDMKTLLFDAIRLPHSNEKIKLITLHFKLKVKFEKLNEEYEKKFENYPYHLNEGNVNDDMISKILGNLSITTPSSRSYIPRCIKICNIKDVFHLTKSGSDLFYASDNLGNIVEFDVNGRLKRRLRTPCSDVGYHSITKNGDLIFSDTEKKTICRFNGKMQKEILFATGKWKPYCIFSSCINDDLLVAVETRKDKFKVARYSSLGEELQIIDRDETGRLLFNYPIHVIENHNGDICVADYKMAVVVVNKYGRYRFSYTGHTSQSEFYPCGMCSDLKGNILVCNGSKKFSSIHKIDQNGNFFAIIVSSDTSIEVPLSVCLFNSRHILVGGGNNTLFVYKINPNEKISFNGADDIAA